ncbi:MAG: Gfo/Idh/MocA family oxidoreductase [Candidatus Hydrogenedentes bacterium]|nr:Gfo/Idh/MocA family oxidoreductase [Candidatus Hydrogenedentota bacterium]
MADKLGVLIQGAGWVSTQHIQAFKANPHTEILAINSLTADEAQARAAEFDLDAACYADYAAALRHPGIDIVAICTPQHLHAQNTIDAANAGKHILIEKPAAMTREDGRAMLAAVQQAGVRTVVSFVLRWNPLFQQIKAMIAEGAIGRVYSVEADYQSYAGDWWGGFTVGRTVDMGGSAFLVAGCHAVDALRWFAAQGEEEAARPVEVFAYAGGLRGQSARQYNPLTHDWHDGDPLEYPGLELALVRFENGVLGKVSVNFECIQPYGFPIRIFGDAGTIRDNALWAPANSGPAWQPIPGITPDSSDVSHHPFQAEIDHFVDCIQRGIESHCNLEDALRTHEVVFAAQRCYQTGAPVRL